MSRQWSLYSEINGRERINGVYESSKNALHARMLADDNVWQCACNTWNRPRTTLCFVCKNPRELPYTRVCSELAEHGLLAEEIVELKTRQERKVSKLLDRAFGKVVNYKPVRKTRISWVQIAEDLK